MKHSIARRISNILNPFLMGLVVILLVSFEATDSIFDAVKWSLVLIVLSVLPVFAFSVYSVRHGKQDSIFVRVRRQRLRVYVLMLILASVSCIILLSLRAPLMLLALSVAGFSAAVVFMGINFWWKISLHGAFIAAVVAVLFTLYGSVTAASVVLIPLVAWSRVEVGYHSPAQVAAGALLGGLIPTAVFYFFGFI